LSPSRILTCTFTVSPILYAGIFEAHVISWPSHFEHADCHFKSSLNKQKPGGHGRYTPRNDFKYKDKTNFFQAGLSIRIDGGRTDRKMIVTVNAQIGFEHCVKFAKNLRRKAQPYRKEAGRAIFPLKQIPGIRCGQDPGQFRSDVGIAYYNTIPYTLSNRLTLHRRVFCVHNAALLISFDPNGLRAGWRVLLVFERRDYIARR